MMFCCIFTHTTVITCFTACNENYVCWEHELNKVWEFETAFHKGLLSYRPWTPIGQLPKHTKISAFYANLMESIGGKHPQSH